MSVRVASSSGLVKDVCPDKASAVAFYRGLLDTLLDWNLFEVYGTPVDTADGYEYWFHVQGNCYLKIAHAIGTSVNNYTDPLVLQVYTKNSGGTMVSCNYGSGNTGGNGNTTAPYVYVSSSQASYTCSWSIRDINHGEAVAMQFRYWYATSYNLYITAIVAKVRDGNGIDYGAGMAEGTALGTMRGIKWLDLCYDHRHPALGFKPLIFNTEDKSYLNSNISNDVIVNGANNLADGDTLLFPYQVFVYEAFGVLLGWISLNGKKIYGMSRYLAFGTEYLLQGKRYVSLGTVSIESDP